MAHHRLCATAQWRQLATQLGHVTFLLGHVSSIRSLAAGLVVAQRRLSSRLWTLSLGSSPNEPAAIELFYASTQGRFIQTQVGASNCHRRCSPWLREPGGRKSQDLYTVQGDSTVTPMIG